MTNSWITVQDFGDGSKVQIKTKIVPKIVWNHVDGPLLYLSDCGLHWLTLWERFCLCFRFKTIEQINNTYVPNKELHV